MSKTIYRKNIQTIMECIGGKDNQSCTCLLKGNLCDKDVLYDITLYKTNDVDIDTFDAMDFRCNWKPIIKGIVSKGTDENMEMITVWIGPNMGDLLYGHPDDTMRPFRFFGLKYNPSSSIENFKILKYFICSCFGDEKFLNIVRVVHRGQQGRVERLYHQGNPDDRIYIMSVARNCGTRTEYNDAKARYYAGNLYKIYGADKTLSFKFTDDPSKGKTDAEIIESVRRRGIPEPVERDDGVEEFDEENPF